MGRSRGRLAVALDLLTDALAMVGQHGVYCQSTRLPGKPALDMALVLEQIGDAKELLQVVIEYDGRDGVRPLDGPPARHPDPVTTSSPAPIGMIAHYNLLERLEPAGPGRSVPSTRHAPRTHGHRATAAGGAHTRHVGSRRAGRAGACADSAVASQHHDAVRRRRTAGACTSPSNSCADNHFVSRWPDGR